MTVNSSNIGIIRRPCSLELRAMIQMIGRTLLSMCEQTFGHSYQMFQPCKVPSEAGLRNCDKANFLWSTGAIKGEEGLPVLGKTEERCYREDIQMQSLIKDPFTNFGATGSLCCVMVS